MLRGMRGVECGCGADWGPPPTPHTRPLSDPAAVRSPAQDTAQLAPLLLIVAPAGILLRKYKKSPFNGCIELLKVLP